MIQTFFRRPFQAYNLFIISFILLTCSGCFEVVEEVSLNSNGSGNVLITLNASRSKEQIKQLMLLDKMDGFPVPTVDEIKAEVSRQKAKLAKQAGISNVKVQEDYQNFIFHISCDFTNAESLENGIIALIKETKHKAIVEVNRGSFSYKNKTLTRKLHIPKPDEMPHRATSEQKGFLKDATYTAIYRFQGEVYKTTNTDVKLAPNKKAIMFRSNILDLLEHRKSPNLYIKHH